MVSKKLIEGYIVTGFGILTIVGSILLPDNPVKLEGWINFVAQARFLPLVSGTAIALLGISLLAEIKKITNASQFTYDIKKQEACRILCVVGIVLLYVIAIMFMGFLVPTALYFLVILFYLNYKLYSPIKIIGMAVLFFLVTYFGLPLMLNITLP